ncbi:MAG: TatD family hydrolase [Ekhidna sp.]|nr:TatD family hydrolase [Ekhidna sp.]
MIDTHAHIYSKEFEKDIEEVINHAVEIGVDKILMPNIDIDSIDPMLKLEENHAGTCYAMMGLHPCYVKDDYKERLKIVEEWFSKRDFLAVGEIGTDLYRDKTYRNQQVEAFHFQCELALKYALPIVIHCRESIDENIAMVEEYAGKGIKGVFHCFTGNIAQAERIIAQGFYLGIGGVSTFKNGGLDKVIPHLDKSKIVLETDAPYLAPTPKRGERNEPKLLTHICEKISAYLEMSFEEVDELTTRNAERLFFPELAL